MPLRPYSDPLKPPYRAPERRGQPPMSTFFTLRKHELAASRGPVRCPRTGTGEAYYGSALAKWNYQANPSKLVPRNPQRRRDMLTLAVPANAVVAVNANPWNPERARETMRYLSEQDKTDQCLMHYQDVISTVCSFHLPPSPTPRGDARTDV